MPTDQNEQPVERHWYAAYTKLFHERKTAENLHKLGIRSFVPVREEIHQWSQRKKKVMKVLIPQMIFVYGTEKERLEALKLPAISHYLVLRGEHKPAVIPDEQMERLKFMLHHADSPVEMNEHIEVGDKVRIARGPLKGLEGELCCVKAAQTLVAVRIESLGFACVNVSRADIEIIIE